MDAWMMAVEACWEMAMGACWQDGYGSMLERHLSIWVHSSVVRAVQISRSLVQIRVRPLGQCAHEAVRQWVEAVSKADTQCKLRRRELNPGLPRDRRKY